VQDQATVGAIWTIDSKTSVGLFYGHAFRKTVNGGNADVRLSEDVVGVPVGRRF
jgi:long-chain fatty acid transport protein